MGALTESDVILRDEGLLGYQCSNGAWTTAGQLRVFSPWLLAVAYYYYYYTLLPGYDVSMCLVPTR